LQKRALNTQLETSFETQRNNICNRIIFKMSLHIANQIPRDIQVPTRTTTGGGILNTQLVEYLPHDVSEFSPDGNLIMEHMIGVDETQWVRWTKSYFKWVIKVSNKGATNRLYHTYNFDEGGISSLIRSIQVLTPSGAEVHRRDYYNRSNALLKIISMDPFTEHQTEWCSGESPLGKTCLRRDPFILSIEDPQQYTVRTPAGAAGEALVIDGVNYTLIPTALGSLSSSAFFVIRAPIASNTGGGQYAPSFKEVAVGYHISNVTKSLYGEVVYKNQWATAIIVKSERERHGRCTDVATQTFYSGNDENEVFSPAAGNYTEPLSVEPRRKLGFNAVDMALGTEYTVTFMPNLSIFGFTFPLGLTPGLRIRFELDVLERGVYPLYFKGESYTLLEQKDNGTNLQIGTNLSTPLLEYTIKTPRLMANVLALHPSLHAEFLNMYNGQGISYYTPSMRTFRFQAQASSNTINITLNIGSRSARQVFFTLQNSQFSDGRTNALNYRSLSSFARAGMTRYQGRIGSFSFPTRHVDVLDTSTEVFRQLMGNTDSSVTRIDQVEFFPNISLCGTKDREFDTTIKNDSTCFIGSLDLRKDYGQDSALTGADTSKVPLELFFEFGDNKYEDYFDHQPVIYVHVISDQFITIKASSLNGFILSK